VKKHMSGNIRIRICKEPYEITTMINKDINIKELPSLYCAIKDRVDKISSETFGIANIYSLESMIPEEFPLFYVETKHEQSLRDSSISEIIVNEIALAVKITSNKYIHFITIPLNDEKEFIKYVKFEKNYMKKLIDLKLRFYPSALMYQVLRKLSFVIQLIEIAFKAIMLTKFKKPSICRIGKFKVFVEVV
jgi:hypothetical protein